MLLVLEERGGDELAVIAMALTLAGDPGRNPAAHYAGRCSVGCPRDV